MQMEDEDVANAPMAEMPYRPLALDIEHRDDGSILLRTPYAPADVPPSIGHLFEARAAEHPGRPFLARRGPNGAWQGPTYGHMRRSARSAAQWLIDQDMPGTGGVMVLSGNSIEHATLMLACYYSSTVCTALSQAFSAMSSDFARLRHCFLTIRPRLVFVQSAAAFEGAIRELRSLDPDLEVISAEGGGPGIIPFAALVEGAADAGVDAALASIGGDTVAKYMFTSGSTGMPKAVPQTHKMMTATLAGYAGLLADPAERIPPFALDWMPWSHLSAGNLTFNQNIWAGGTLHLDEGRPVGDAFATTLRNLVELRPVTMGSAPIAFEMLASALERDPEAAKAVFSRLRWMAYGGAALSQSVADRLQRLAVVAVGRRIPFVTSYGSTEVQAVTTVSWATDKVGFIGFPIPGVTLKLAPVADKLEVRIMGPSVMTGYLGRAQPDREAFDEEGFYRLGDAARLLDAADLRQGIVFDGRISEDFKLSSGTWVSVGPLRTAMIAAGSPDIIDAAVTGGDRPFVGALLWVTPEVAGDAARIAALCEKLKLFNHRQGGSSRRVQRVLIQSDPPSVPAGEITEKGYLNQRAILANRAADVERLYTAEPDVDVLIVD
ncbi:AMP-binding protein [Sphingopyxis macrogoltabida]|nr:AMP-binding protein [Sphingopyxis macrogoltabida]